MKEANNISNELIFKVLSKESTESENKIFQEWLGLSSKNQKIFFQIERLWKDSKGIVDYYKVNQEYAWSQIYRKITPKHKTRILHPIVKVAAAVVVAFLLGASAMYFIQPVPQQKIFVSKEICVKAPLGSKTEVELSDGTEVWLNSGSEIRYPATFRKNQRDIYLVGEAFFDVEKNVEAPFFVHADEVDIRVLGTSFNVKSYPEEDIVETTLVEGLINMNKKGSNQVFQLKPNEKATFIKNREEISGKETEQFIITKNVDAKLYTSWKNGMLIFKKEKFGDLVIKMERWYNVRITIENKQLTGEKVTGSFQNESIEQALEALKISVPFSYKINKNDININ